MLKINETAPVFEAKNSEGQFVNVGGISSKITVIYFYPKDDTPSCTIQANDFSALKDSYENQGAIVYGISKDNTESHSNFINKFNLKIELLTDEKGDICESYNTWGEKEKNGVKKIGIIRSTFIIGKDGMLKYVEYKVKAKDHAKGMLKLISQFT